MTNAMLYIGDDNVFSYHHFNCRLNDSYTAATADFAKFNPNNSASVYEQ